MKHNEIRKSVIENYIAVYNNFDIERMLKDFGENIVFQNISGDEVNLKTKGIAEFKKQAEQGAEFFSQREQKITGWKFGAEEVEVEIFYRGTAAADLPNGLKSGDEIELGGKSIFRFADDKIVEIKDIS